jgi:hypothetical protein
LSFDVDHLLDLLPDIYRIRDIEQGGPLRNLLKVIAGQVSVLEEDMAQLYDDLFIETCAEWTVPYIGDLIGQRSLKMAGSQGLGMRAQVANTMAMRRRKGTFSKIDELVRDAAGWDSVAVEYFRRLALTENLNHSRPESSSRPDLRQWDRLLDLQSPFNNLPHNAEIRTASSGQGRYNLSNLGIFIWRLNSYPLTGSDCFKVDEHRFMFNPLGCNTQLFARPERSVDPPIMPGPISREMLFLDLERYFGTGKSISLQIRHDDQDPESHDIEIEASSVVACDLSDLLDEKGVVRGWANMPVSQIAIDPVLGRIAFPELVSSQSLTPKVVRAGFCYGFSADLGGGEYARSEFFEIKSERTNSVSKTKKTDSEEAGDDLKLFKDALNELGQDGGIVEISDSGRYVLINQNRKYLDIYASSGRKIEIRAAEGCRPVLVGNIVVKGLGEVSLNGLVLTGGGLTVSNRLKHLLISHCTIVPGSILAADGQPIAPQAFSIEVRADDAQAEVTVEIERSIVGPLKLPKDGAELVVKDCIVDSPGRGEGAREYPFLVSGEIEEMISETRSGAINVTIARKGPYRVLLPKISGDLETLRSDLEKALVSAHTSLGFRGARVVGKGRRLIIIPGVPGGVTVEATRESDLAGRLKLEAHHAFCSRSLLGGIVSLPLKLSAVSPSFKIIINDGTALKIKMGGIPSNCQEAAAMIQEAMEGHKDLNDMMAAQVDGRLAIFRTGEGEVPRLRAAENDNTTLAELGLEMSVPAIAGLDGDAGPDTSIEGSTVFGVVRVKKLVIANQTIFSDPVYVSQRQEGSVRFSFIAQGSRTPGRYECQPKDDDSWSEGLRFTSTRYGEPGYGQLSRLCAPGILLGDDGGEMGAFHLLYQPQREINLRVVLDENMRFGIDWGIFFMT